VHEVRKEELAGEHYLALRKHMVRILQCALREAAVNTALPRAPEHRFHPC
jgi:hypothetical protein